MQSGAPSRTALSAAAHRAAHQVLEGGRVFSDPLALRILGGDGAEAVRASEAHPARGAMRAFIAARARVAEDALTASLPRGVRQVVILGAGLDTFAYRTRLAPGLHVFEVDHPATQAWKRERLIAAGIAIPPALTFAPVDFEQETPAEGLRAAGFDPGLRSFFIWLGVVIYLSEETVFAVLRDIAANRGGAHVVFDYAEPLESLTAEMQVASARRAEQVAALGEPWRTRFDPPRLHARLSALGFTAIEDFGPADLAARYWLQRAADKSRRGGHVLHAATD